MTRIEYIVKRLNQALGEAELPETNFTRYGICTKITGRFNQSTVGSSYVWDVLRNDWVFFSAHRPIIYHVLSSENIIPMEFEDDINSVYHFTTALIFDRKLEYSDSQIVEWFKRRFLFFNSISDQMTASIGGNFDAEISNISYTSEQNYFAEYPVTSENYTPQVGCIKIEWSVNLNYNACGKAPQCEYENFC